MTDAITGAAVPNSKAITGAFKESMGFSAQGVLLYESMIAVLNRWLRHSPLEPHPLKLKHHKCSKDVLQQRLVNTQLYL